MNQPYKQLKALHYILITLHRRSAHAHPSGRPETHLYTGAQQHHQQQTLGDSIRRTAGCPSPSNGILQHTTATPHPDLPEKPSTGRPAPRQQQVMLSEQCAGLKVRALLAFPFGPAEAAPCTMLLSSSTPVLQAWAVCAATQKQTLQLTGVHAGA